jgi:hypothetical protein
MCPKQAHSFHLRIYLYTGAAADQRRPGSLHYNVKIISQGQTAACKQQQTKKSSGAFFFRLSDKIGSALVFMFGVHASCQR